MNEVNNQSLRSIESRASLVNVNKATATPLGGKKLPVAKQRQQNIANGEAATKQNNKKIAMLARDRVEKAVARMNEYTQSIQRDLRFNLDEESGRVVVNVIDRKSQEVIRQIPDETFLKMARMLKEDLAVGSKDSLRLINVSV